MGLAGGFHLGQLKSAALPGPVILILTKGLTGTKHPSRPPSPGWPHVSKASSISVEYFLSLSRNCRTDLTRLSSARPCVEIIISVC